MSHRQHVSQITIKLKAVTSELRAAGVADRDMLAGGEGRGVLCLGELAVGAMGCLAG